STTLIRKFSCSQPAPDSSPTRRSSDLFPVTIAYRADWAEALGIEEPTTVEEFAAMMQAFKDQDPGGVGSALIPFVPNRLSGNDRSEEHTSELQSREKLVCRLLLDKKKK